MRGAVLRYESRIQAMVPQTQTVGSTASSCCVVWSDPRRALPSRNWMDPDPYLQAGSSMVFFVCRSVPWLRCAGAAHANATRASSPRDRGRERRGTGGRKETGQLEAAAAQRSKRCLLSHGPVAAHPSCPRSRRPSLPVALPCHCLEVSPRRRIVRVSVSTVSPHWCVLAASWESRIGAGPSHSPQPQEGRRQDSFCAAVWPGPNRDGASRHFCRASSI
jgi:hypothetical protein